MLIQRYSDLAALRQLQHRQRCVRRAVLIARVKAGLAALGVALCVGCALRGWLG